jgi:hypothetical protein
MIFKYGFNIQQGVCEELSPLTRILLKFLSPCMSIRRKLILEVKIIFVEYYTVISQIKSVSVL